MNHQIIKSAKQDPDLEKAEIAIAYLLRYGVIVCAVVLTAGWFFAITGHGSSLKDFAGALSGGHDVTVIFPLSRGEYFSKLRNFDSVVWIQSGLFLLILLPISRVFLAMMIFLFERNWKFVAFSLVVLVILVESMLNGKAA